MKGQRWKHVVVEEKGERVSDDGVRNSEGCL